MSTDRIQTTLADRAKALSANIAVFYVGLYVASGNMLPSGGGERLVFERAGPLVSRASVRPLVRSAKGRTGQCDWRMAILVTADLGATGTLKPHLEIMRWVAVAYCLATMVGRWLPCSFTIRTSARP